MITGQHATIRTADADDAVALKQYYDLPEPHAAQLDRKREVIVPTVDELQEVLVRKDKEIGPLYVIENPAGEVEGFCALRGITTERSLAEVSLMLLRDGLYASPLADEALAFLFDSAFSSKFLNKVVAHCLRGETGYRAALVRNGFESEGAQRDAVYTRGLWHDLESFRLFRGDCGRKAWA